ncbi:hypothetical protein AB2F98_01640 [Escherichia coli]
MLRRQIASVGCIKGPLSLALMRKLSVDDFQRLSLATECDMAVAASLTQERGQWLRCRNDIEKAATAIGVILKSGPGGRCLSRCPAFPALQRAKPSLNITVKSGNLYDRETLKASVIIDLNGNLSRRSRPSIRTR